jgi:hypothetical protein
MTIHIASYLGIFFLALGAGMCWGVALQSEDTALRGVGAGCAAIGTGLVLLVWG